MKILRAFFLTAMAFGIFTGCATTRDNWDNRVGKLTFIQAVTELGPPAKQIQNADGSTVAEWISRYRTSTAGMDSDFRYHSASFGPEADSSDWHESKLSLTFNTNRLLTGWSKD